MGRMVTSEILLAYGLCPRKAFLLMCTHHQGTLHEYTQILAHRREQNCQQYLQMFKKEHPDARQYAQESLGRQHVAFVNVVLTVENMQASCASLTPREMPSSNRQGHSIVYEPAIVIEAQKITRNHKLELFFVAYVLEHLQHALPDIGYIVDLKGKLHRTHLENSTKILTPYLVPLREWSVTIPTDEPPVILNKHCVICQYSATCHRLAERDDLLSRLYGISTQKALNRYEKKGIFTVKQLSYTFKLKRRKKRTKNPPPVVHKPELQALALREQKIYIHELPQLPRAECELFIDLEGIPDQQFYYLIGLLVCEGTKKQYFPFWANTQEDEASIWHSALTTINRYPDAPLYHYGNFEPRAFAALAKRYGADLTTIPDRFVNVNTFIFGKVYFPTYSNGLKDIGHFLGVEWAAPDASGIQSLVWRFRWEESHDEDYRQRLLRYNQDDCEALRIVTEKLSSINESAQTLTEVDFANQPKQRTTLTGEQVHQQFESVLKFG